MKLSRKDALRKLIDKGSQIEKQLINKGSH
jgi:hypothetical protein